MATRKQARDIQPGDLVVFSSFGRRSVARIETARLVSIARRTLDYTATYLGDQRTRTGSIAEYLWLNVVEPISNTEALAKLAGAEGHVEFYRHDDRIYA
ncbi:hypothetical protein SEA_PUPPER_198 [Gordonia phage Pupper]|uniref:Uncharacterized protein n=1 Tax=Gordonia phage Pupper TaxID=2571249 RepID=A0A4Y6ETN9_9CAUD|nr:hypothetical protein KHQ83_gp079 [Gordonia phage Pupper]QDF18684.1 hypothetical protein SEA_PUPPER_198 [Gordonia phage Pupper]QDF18916.1 hypothetical protein SEA_SCENTAE_197 [Gordonia phage SCentae]